MKTLLIMLIVGICAIGLRSPEIMRAVGFASSAQDPAISIQTLTDGQPKKGMQPMSAAEFAELAKTDPHAYQKFLGSLQSTERSEVDKLLNFLARGKYE